MGSFTKPLVGVILLAAGLDATPDPAECSPTALPPIKCVVGRFDATYRCRMMAVAIYRIYLRLNPNRQPECLICSEKTCTRLIVQAPFSVVHT